MEIIGAGFGRTGTMSLQFALNKLGFGPCYHFSDVLTHPGHIKIWQAAAEGQPVDWQAFFKDYRSGVDYPIAGFYKELCTAFPDAKVILTVRDPQRWYDSTLETIYKGAAIPQWVQRILPPYRELMPMVHAVAWQRIFGGRFEEREHAIQVFNDWIEEVKRSVPPEKLLVFEVKEGWEQLCAFLGVPVPDEPFPRVNDRRMTKVMYGTAQIVMPLLAAGILYGLYRLVSSLF